MASAERFGHDGEVIIRAKQGKVILKPREADEILADLQIMYHEMALGLAKEERKSNVC